VNLSPAAPLRRALLTAAFAASDSPLLSTASLTACWCHPKRFARQRRQLFSFDYCLDSASEDSLTKAPDSCSDATNQSAKQSGGKNVVLRRAAILYARVYVCL